MCQLLFLLRFSFHLIIQCENYAIRRRDNATTSALSFVTITIFFRFILFISHEKVLNTRHSRNRNCMKNKRRVAPCVYIRFFSRAHTSFIFVCFYSSYPTCSIKYYVILNYIAARTYIYIYIVIIVPEKMRASLGRFNRDKNYLFPFLRLVLTILYRRRFDSTSDISCFFLSGLFGFAINLRKSKLQRIKKCALFVLLCSR